MYRGSFKHIILVLAGFFLFLMLTQTLKAQVTIQINKGVSKPFSLAIVASGKSVQANKILKIVKRDLTNSGRFAINHQAVNQKPLNTDSVNKARWQNFDSNHLMTIEINQQTDNRYQVKLKLMSRLQNQLLVKQLFKEVKPSELSDLAHRLSDQVFQAVTGMKGYFSTKLAYVRVENPYGQLKSRYSLVVSDYDGRNPQTVVSKKAIPINGLTWSKDGHSIAYVTYQNGRMSIKSINLLSMEKSIIASFKGINSAPDYSPVNNNLVIALSRGDQSVTNLYMAKRKNSEAENLTYQQITYAGTNTSPDFSPDGKRIVFTSTRSGAPQVYLSTLNQAQAHRLTFKGHRNFNPVFTSDGQSIIFMHQRYAGGNIKLAKLNLENDKMQIITDGPVDKSPSTSPGGRMIVYTALDKQGEAGLKMVSENGRVQIKLPTKGYEHIRSPAWSPFIKR